jgi:Bacterial Ig-like domain/PKD domain
MRTIVQKRETLECFTLSLLFINIIFSIWMLTIHSDFQAYLALAQEADNVTGNQTTTTATATPIIAIAGDDKTLSEGETVQLNGSASRDPQGGTLTYAWNQTAGASVILSDASSATPTFTAPDVGANGDTLTFELTVNDTSGQTATDSVNVNVSSDGDSVSPQNVIDQIFQSYLPHLFIVIVFLVITIPFVLDMILAYRRIPAGGNGSKRALGMPGLNRSVMTFGIITLLGTVIFYLLALITLNMDNAGSPAFQALIDLLRNLGIILGTALATIIAFYFGVRGTESAVEKAAAAVTESISPTKLRDVKGPPKVLYTTPEDGDEEVPVTTLIDVTFSEPMSHATINRSSFTVKKKDVPKPIPGVMSLTPDAKTAQFDPDGDLDPSTTYVAEINQGAKDLAGNPLVATHQWSFSTASAPSPRDDEDKDDKLGGKEAAAAKEVEVKEEEEEEGKDKDDKL